MTSELGDGAVTRLCYGPDALDAFVADLEALGLHRLRDGPQRLSLSPQSHHLADGLLLALMPRRLAMLAATITEWHDAAEIAAPRFLVSLDLPNPFADAVALGLSESCGDGQEQLREPVARNIPAKIE